MRTIEVEIDEMAFEELKLSSTHISFDELQRKLAVKKFTMATNQMRAASVENGMGSMTEDEIFSMVKKEKQHLH